jgi:ELWxxDGT repeat protein
MNSNTGNPINLNINYQNGASNPSHFTALGNTLYFTANDGYSGTELWRIVANSYPQQVQDINPGIGSSNPHNLTVIDNILNFSTDDGINGTKMWRIDPNTGTPNPLSI